MCRGFGDSLTTVCLVLTVCTAHPPWAANCQKWAHYSLTKVAKPSNFPVYSCQNKWNPCKCSRIAHTHDRWSMSMILLLIQGHMPPVGSATAFCNALSCRHDGIRRHWQHEPNPLLVLCSPSSDCSPAVAPLRGDAKTAIIVESAGALRKRRRSICHRQR